MTIIKIASYYNSFLKSYYNSYPHIINVRYLSQHTHLMSQAFAWADFYSKAFIRKGHSAFEIVHNAEPLQNQWAKEHETKSKNKELLLEQIAFYSPDVLWFQDSLSFDASFINKIRNQFKNIKLIIGYSCAPYSIENLADFKAYDFMVSCSPFFIEEFTKQGIKAMLLYHAFEPTILNRVGVSKRQNEIVFIGSIIPRKGFHIRRKQFLETLAQNKKFKFIFFGSIDELQFSKVLKIQILYIIKMVLVFTRLNIFLKNYKYYKKIENISSFPVYLKLSNILLSKHRNAKYGIEMYKKLANSKLTFDIQVSTKDEYARNMRMFEATGMGVCLLIENKNNIKDLFVPNEEVVIVDSFDDAIKKLKELINNPDKLERIALAGQKRTLKEHTHDNRVDVLIQEINKYL